MKITLKTFSVTLALLVAAPGLAVAAECPPNVNPCRVVFLTPEQYSWLVGTPQSSAGSVMDAAAKSLGSDAAPVIATLLLVLRAAQPGTPYAPPAPAPAPPPTAPTQQPAPPASAPLAAPVPAEPPK